MAINKRPALSKGCDLKSEKQQKRNGFRCSDFGTILKQKQAAKIFYITRKDRYDGTIDIASHALCIRNAIQRAPSRNNK
jgi:hypothetical protein